MSAAIIQAIGFVGMAFFIVSYQIRSNRGLFLCQFLGCCVFCLQFCIMGAYSGALGLLVNIARNLLLLKAKDWTWVRSRATLLSIILLLLIMTVFTWAGWISLLPFLSVTVTCIGYWTDNGQKIRLSQLIGSPCTLLYDLMICSWGGVLSETITLLSIIISIFRFGWASLNNKEAAY